MSVGNDDSDAVKKIARRGERVLCGVTGRETGVEPAINLIETGF
jgi:hypothetical protein